MGEGEMTPVNSGCIYIYCQVTDNVIKFQVSIKQSNKILKKVVE